MIKFEVLGKPIGKGRPRFARRGKYVGTYSPKKTVEYEKLVKEAYLSHNFKKYETGALKLKIIAEYKPPTSVSKKKQKELIGKYRPIKPDIDNITKIIMDALNGLAYTDDNQITLLLVAKQYGEEDRVLIELDDI